MEVWEAINSFSLSLSQTNPVQAGFEFVDQVRMQFGYLLQLFVCRLPVSFAGGFEHDGSHFFEGGWTFFPEEVMYSQLLLVEDIHLIQVTHNSLSMVEGFITFQP